MPFIPKQYASARLWFKGYPNLGNIPNPDDRERITAYNLYDDFYYNRPETFKVTKRGTTDTELYVPSTKKIVNSTARYLAVGFDHVITGEAGLKEWFANIWIREEISKRFVRGKRSLLTRGDQMWYITADDRKKKGERITLNTIHPQSVFRIEDPENGDRVIGYHIVDLVPDPREPKGKKTTKQIARRQTYRKVNGRITTECVGFEIGTWDDRVLEKDKLKPVWQYMEEKTLPEEITQLPIYHIPNDEPDGSSWGVSQVAGVEYLINGMNQAITYEDLSLVLQGLGVYVTTASPPIDPITKKPAKYRMHPGNVIEISEGDSFERVTGVASVAPWQDHMKSLDQWATIGLPDMATGDVDVQTAESGIARILKMAPILAENEDKQLGIESKWNQMAYDLIKGWIPAFEERGHTGTFKVTFEDPMPIDRAAYIQERVDLWTIDAITTEQMIEDLEKIGYKKVAAEELYNQMQEKADKAMGSAFGEEGATSPNLVGALGNSTNGRVLNGTS
jgi:hypothetical protein